VKLVKLKDQSKQEMKIRRNDMKFMMLVKHPENSRRPPKELMDAIAILAEEAVSNKTMISNGGLAPTAQSTRVRVENGKLTVIDGPFTEAKEVIGGFAQFEFKSKKEAVDSAIEFMELHTKYWPEWQGETEIRQIFGPEDFQQCADQREEATATKIA
jgi:hypothetical protein